MYTAFKHFLSKLDLGLVSRKLYLADILKFLTWLSKEDNVALDTITLDQVSSPRAYVKYLDLLKSSATAPSIIKRTVASLHQFGTFLATTHHIASPAVGISYSDLPRPSSSCSALHEEYIKHFTNYLKSAHLSLSTIKSYKSDIARYLDWGSNNLSSNKTVELLKDQNIKKYLIYLSEGGSTLPSTIDRKSKSLTRFKDWYQTHYEPTKLPDSMNRHSLGEMHPHLPSSTPLLSPPPKASPGISSSSVKIIDSRNSLSKLWSLTSSFSARLSKPSLRTTISLGILLLFVSTLAIFGYRQFSQDVRLTSAFPTSPITPNRQLSFQGRLESAAGTPITTSTSFVFKLFDAATLGTELYSTGTCSITPDGDGVFNTQIGSTCGAGIPSSVFSENSDVWLEVTVGAEVLDPRQQIATVAYALNSETLQGFPLSSTVSAIANTVVPMNQWGEIIVGEQSPKLTGVSGTFQISAPSLALTTTTGSNGDIAIAPDGTGEINITGNTNIVGNLDVDGQVDLGDGTGTVTISGTSITLTGFDCTSNTNGGALTTNGSGVISCSDDDGGGGGGSFTDLTSGTNTTAAMVVGTGASLNFSGSGTINASTLLSGTWASPGAIGSTTPNSGAFTTLSANGIIGLGDGGDAITLNGSSITLTGIDCTSYTNGGALTTNGSGVISCSDDDSGGTNYWTRSAGNISPLTLNDTISASTSAAVALTLTQTGPFNALVVHDSAGDTTPFVIDQFGNVGIGTATASTKLDIGGTTGEMARFASNAGVSDSNYFTVGGARAMFGYDGSSGNTVVQGIGGKGIEFNVNNGTFGSGTAMTILSGGNIGIGTTGPDAKLDSLATSGEQLRLSYTDGSVYAGFTVNSSGQLTITPTGNITTLTGDTYITSGLSTYSTAVSDGTIEATRFCTGDGETNCVTDFAPLVAGSSLWTDAGSYLYPTAAEVLGNSTSGGANKLDGIYLGSTSPLVFGADNDVSFSYSGSTLGSTFASGRMLGINTTSALATLDVRSSLGTIPVASISGSTSMAALVVDQSGSGDIFTASSAGETRFVVKSNGNVGIGVTDPTNKLEIGGATSTISNSSGDITINSASGNISFAGDSLINILNTYVSGELGVGIADAIGRFHVHGSTTGKALAILNELGDQDILTASSSGTTRFRLTNDGSLSLDGDYLNFGLTDGTSGYGFRDNGGTLQFKHNSGSWADVGSGGASWWDQVSGTIQPYNKTVDLLLGGTATSSARIGLINVDSGTPTATLSAGTSGGLYITASGTIATTAKQTLALGDASTTGNIILQGGNVGIGVASPTEKLEVNGYVVAQRFVDSSSSLFYLDPASSGTSLSIEGDIVSNGAFSISSNGNNNITINAGSGTVMIGTTGAGKLDAGTIDPPYTINGDKFATYMAGMTGVKEETTGTVIANEYIPGSGYRATLDFASSLTGSDLWLFTQTTNLGQVLDQLVVLTTAAGNSKTWYEVDALAGRLYLYAQTPTLISYRLTAPRYDASTWLNTRGDDSTSIGHVIDNDGKWSVSQSVANFFSSASSNLVETIFPALSTDLLSPLASNSAIVVTRNPSSTPSLPPTAFDPVFVVDGELAADRVSARQAYLSDVVADTITARDIVADTITANTIIGLDAKIASLSGLSDDQLTSITDRIKARLQTLSGVEGLSINEPSAEDVPVPDSDSGTVTQWHSDTASSSATLASADIDFATINHYLAVIGQATITTLDVTDTLYTSTINSKSGLLALGDGTLIVDSSGTVAINGDLLVSGRILADSASLNSLEIGTSNTATASALANLLSIYNEAGETVATIDASGSANLASLTTGMITITGERSATDSSALSSLLGNNSSNSTAGVSKIVSPSTEVTINSPYITDNSLIYLTPTGNTSNKVVFVKSKNSCNKNYPETVEGFGCTSSFTVAIDSPALSDISFNWWIIELGQPKEDQQI